MVSETCVLVLARDGDFPVENDTQEKTTLSLKVLTLGTEGGYGEKERSADFQVLDSVAELWSPRANRQQLVVAGCNSLITLRCHASFVNSDGSDSILDFRLLLVFG